MAIYVFVYGTLRSGEINDLEKLAQRLGLAPPQRLGPAAMPGTLYDFGDWPGLVESAVGRVVGEVYQVDPALLAAVDAVEEYEPGGNTLFVRRSVELDVAGKALSCFFYPIDPAQRGAAIPIDHDDWIAYRQTRAPRAG